MPTTIRKPPIKKPPEPKDTAPTPLENPAASPTLSSPNALPQSPVSPEQPADTTAIRAAVKYLRAISDLVKDIKEAGEVVALFYSAFVLAFWLDQNSPIKLVHSIIIGVCLTILFAILRNWANSLLNG